MEFVIISGMSGAGKSKAASFLEDAGFYTVDNMPPVLMPKFAELCMAGNGRYDRVALVNDVRGGESFDDFFAALDTLKRMNCPYTLLFLDASRETIIKRYKETRRNHPLADETASLEEADRLEREILAPVRARADHIIDTTALSTAKLRGEILRLFDTGETKGGMHVNVVSFGFKYGLPIEADLVFDVRFLPNPFYVPELRQQTGLDNGVRDYLAQFPETEQFLTHLRQMIGFLLPLYVEEGKSALVIAVGCTGGQHRSVAVTRALAEFIRQQGYQVSENHRDMTRA